MSTDLNKFLFKDVIWQTEILCNFAHRGIRGEEVPQGTYTHGNRPDHRSHLTLLRRIRVSWLLLP